MRAIDLTSQRFGRLVALRAESFNGRRKWLCQCDCGNQIWINTGGLRSGGTKSCGCLRSEYLDLTGQRFGHLVVISLNKEKSKGGHYYWDCMCDCGNIAVVSTSNLTNKDERKKVISCGCRKREKTSERFSAHIEGQRFGKLVVLKRVGTQIQDNGDKKSYWLCRCDCGTEIKVIAKNLLNGNTQSCGCVISRGELLVREYLNKNNVIFSTQKTFPDLLSDKSRKLRFDFAVYDKEDNLVGLIEYQGVQHYIDTGIGKTEREVTDKRKYQYCLERKIPLLLIPYNQNLERLIDNFLDSINYTQTLCLASNEEGATTIRKE